jgi:hypothetical protein
MHGCDDQNGAGLHKAAQGRTASYVAATTGVPKIVVNGADHTSGIAAEADCQRTGGDDVLPKKQAEPSTPFDGDPEVDSISQCAQPPVSLFSGAGLWSTFTYTWMSGLIREGKKRGEPHEIFPCVSYL